MMKHHPSLVERLRRRIQDPNLTTTISQYAPRQGGLYPPTTLAAVKAAEAELGFRLPGLLRVLYTEVANGGFGPGYGLFGLEGGYIAPDIINHFQGGTLVEWYFAMRGSEPLPTLSHDFGVEGKNSLFIEPGPDAQGWFDKLLPVCNHGCWQLSCVDCAQPDFPVLFFIGYGGEFRLENPTFEGWIEDWLNSP